MIKIDEPAQNDLRDIWLYIAESNMDAANKLLEEFEAKFRLLEKNPNIGNSRNHLLVNLRMFPVKSYLIFYLPIENGIEVFRVLHAARNIDQLFGDFFEGLPE